MIAALTMVAITDLSGVKFNPETGLYEVEERSPEGESNLYGGRNITLQNTGADITRRAGAATGGIDYGKIGADAGAASIAAQVGEDGTTPAEYFAGIQEQIDSYVPGTFGAEYLAQVQAEREAAAPVEDKEEEPYESEVKSLKIPKNVLEEISTGYKGSYKKVIIKIKKLVLMEKVLIIICLQMEIIRKFNPCLMQEWIK